MAGRIGIARAAEQAIAVDTAETIVQLLAAANHAILIDEIGIGFDSVAATDEPVLVELVRQSDAGTSSSLTIVKADDNQGDTFDTSALSVITAEPTTGDVLRSWRVHPQAGLIYQPTERAPLIVKAAGRLGLRVTSKEALNCFGYIQFIE